MWQNGITKAVARLKNCLDTNLAAANSLKKMNTTITGRVICAGRIVDHNGDFFDGIMIETGVDELTDKSIPFYQNVVISPKKHIAIDVSNAKSALIDLIMHRPITDDQCREMSKAIETMP